MEEPNKLPEYTKPLVKDYGDLRELTATSSNQPITDVPLGQPVQTTTPG